MMLARGCCANAQRKMHRFFALEITSLDGRICPGAVRASPHSGCQGRTCQPGLVPLPHQLQGSQVLNISIPVVMMMMGQG